MTSLKMGIFIYQHCTASMVIGVLDILSVANMQSGLENGESLFEIETISETGKPVRCFNGFSINPDRSIRAKGNYDLIYIPGFIGDVDEILQREKRGIAWLRQQFKKGIKLAAACNGNFILAETGVLANRRATTHWNLMDKFRERYKNVLVQPERIIVDEGDTISAAGVTAYFNLALFLIDRKSTRLNSSHSQISYAVFCLKKKKKKRIKKKRKK